MIKIVVKRFFIIKGISLDFLEERINHIVLAMNWLDFIPRKIDIKALSNPVEYIVTLLFKPLKIKNEQIGALRLMDKNKIKEEHKDVFNKIKEIIEKEQIIYKIGD